MNSLIKNSIFNIVYSLTSLLFPLITMSYVSRVLEPEGIGVISYVQNISYYFILIASVGIPYYGIREIAKLNNDYESRCIFFYGLFLVNIAFSIIASILYCMLILSNHKFQEYINLYLIFGVPILFSFINIDWFYKGIEEFYYIAVRNLIVKIIFIILIFIFVREKSDYISYVILLNFGTMLNYIINIYHVRKYVKFEFQEKIKLKKYIKPIIYFSLMFFLGAISNNIDITLVGLTSSNDITGNYSNAHRGVDAIISMCTAVTGVLLPRLSSCYGDIKYINNILMKSFNLICFLGFPVVIGVFVLSDNISELLFGNSFVYTGEIMRILSILILIKFFGDLFGFQLLISAGQERKSIIVNLIGLLINIIIFYSIYPFIGYISAAIALISSQFIINILLFFIVKNAIHFNISWRTPTLQAILASLIMGITINIIKLYCNLEVFMETVVSVLLGIIIYISINWFLKNELLFQIVFRIKEKL